MTTRPELVLATGALLGTPLARAQPAARVKRIAIVLASSLAHPAIGPEGREACRSSRRAADPLRAGHEPENGQGYASCNFNAHRLAQHAEAKIR